MNGCVGVLGKGAGGTSEQYGWIVMSRSHALRWSSISVKHLFWVQSELLMLYCTVLLLCLPRATFFCICCLLFVLFYVVGVQSSGSFKVHGVRTVIATDRKYDASPSLWCFYFLFYPLGYFLNTKPTFGFAVPRGRCTRRGWRLF